MDDPTVTSSAPHATAESGAAAVPAAPPGRRRMVKRVVLSVVLVAILAAAALWGQHWWTVGRFTESTDNAYVEADIVTIAPQVAGGIVEVAVRDNQRVAAGDVLLRIDAVAYEADLDAAAADRRAASATLTALQARVALQRTKIDAASAQVEAANASLDQATSDDERQDSLGRSGTVSVQARQDARTNLARATAAVAGARAGLASEREQLKVVQSEREQDEAALAKAVATLARREDDVAHTVIVAPRAGIVGNIGARTGEYTSPGRALMSLVPVDDVHVIANFKETQIGAFREGMSATVVLDAFGDVELAATIDSLAPASGAEFSVLPTDNATGNFTKIVQRLPVRVRLDDVPSDLAGRLRPGLSATVDVSTRS